ncbi:MAG: peptidylprolyl isomerase [Pseudohongiellaceae bacterium]|jgi:FKBP-type peptidyl-prolyl cis-trans isomerase SlpA
MTDSDPQIEPGSGVSLHFSLTLTDGQEIDSNFGAKPASFNLGDGNMLPGFEEVLLGMRAGDEVEQTLPAEKAFGEINPANRQNFPRDKFGHLLDDELMPASEGSVVSFRDPAGFELPGVVEKITAQTITVNFNHPLAGKAIVFRAHIVSVLPPSVQPVQVKL